MKRLLVIDFVSDGHHPAYIVHLVQFAYRSQRTDLEFSIFRELYDSVSTRLSPGEQEYFTSRVRLLDTDRVWVKLTRWVKVKSLVLWLYVEYLNLAESRRSDLLYAYLESVIYPVAFSPIPRFATSGLMFRATFYYRQRGMLSPGLTNRALFGLKWLVGYLCAKRPGIQRIFLLDPLAEEYAKSHWGSRKFVLAPDPLGAETRTVRPLGHDRSISDRPIRFLLAGALHPRKGLHLMVDALEQSSPETRANVAMVVVGRPEAGAQDYVRENLARLASMGVETVSDLRFISDAELEQHVADAHVLLTPYVGFKGSSGILIHAAHFGKPVISTNDGLLGYLVPHHSLGAAVEVRDPRVFAATLDRLVASGRVEGFDPDAARAFADGCDPEHFARTLLSRA